VAIGSVANLIAEPWQATLIGALGYVCVCLALCVHACDRVWERLNTMLRAILAYRTKRTFR
jgi:hypothetical protein